jgi:FkbM family methyltransferase
MKNLYRMSWLRAATIPALKMLAFDFVKRHPWVANCKYKLNSFRHKGYWYHGASREAKTMELFRRLIEPGDTVVEVGGHIGFISLYFADLVGESGRVQVFEPGSNNLPYIRKNVSADLNPKHSVVITLNELAIGSEKGIIEFYEDSLTGQNNSAVKDFDGLKNNQAASFVKSDVSVRKVEVGTIDERFDNRRVDFIKIDIEGYEWPALQGARRTIERENPALMVEIQADREEIFSFFSHLNYVMFDESLAIALRPEMLHANIFFLHRIKHAKKLAAIGVVA